MRYIVWIVIQLCVFSAAQGYELYTHSSITQAIWINAAQVAPDLFTLTGLNDDDEIGGVSPEWTHPYYYDFTQDAIDERRAADFSKLYVDNALKAQGDPAQYRFTAEGWMIRGSVREDDIPKGGDQVVRSATWTSTQNGKDGIWRIYDM